ncbi:unnamed protein product [Sphagnum balticum]
MGDHEEEEEEAYCREVLLLFVLVRPPAFHPSFIPRVQVGMTKLACTPFVAASTLTPSPKQQYFAGNEKNVKGVEGGGA